MATDSGLITPIVFTANNKGLRQINSDMNELKNKAVEGKLQPNEFQVCGSDSVRECSGVAIQSAFFKAYLLIKLHYLNDRLRKGCLL